MRLGLRAGGIVPANGVLFLGSGYSGEDEAAITPIFADAVRAFVSDCAETKTGTLFNPWSQICPQLDLDQDAAEKRRDRLLRHLLCPDAALILCGEAPGYAGCRSSGVPFSSERLLVDGAIPRIAPLAGRITRRRLPFSEQSATILWTGLYGAGMAERTILWNAVPWHPSLKDEPLSNRPPDEAEVVLGRPFLERLIELFPRARIVAVGRVAEYALAAWGVDCATLRHPAHGGAAAFKAGLLDLCRDLS